MDVAHALLILVAGVGIVGGVVGAVLSLNASSEVKQLRESLKKATDHCDTEFLRQGRKIELIEGVVHMHLRMPNTPQLTPFKSDSSLPVRVDRLEQWAENIGFEGE